MFNMKLGIVVALCAGAGLATNAQIVNGSFETPDAGGSYSAFVAPSDVGGWIVENGSVEVVGTYWQAAVGNQSLDLSGIWDWAGTIYQDIATEPGKQYLVRFALSGNPEGGDPVKKMKAFWNEEEMANLTFDTTGHTKAEMGWKYYSYVVTASGATSRLKFQSLTFEFLGPVIDDVSVVAYMPSTLKLEMFPGVSVTGVVGAVYRVEYSEDAKSDTWVELATVTIPTEGVARILDADATRPHKRIYRSLLISTP
jgi:choice-of-anchor C domain-containing protein